MEAVLKVGGSLAEDPKSLTNLCQELTFIAKSHSIFIVPGGGKFADSIRKFEETYDLSDIVAHKMAILAMDQYGLFLSDITPDSHVSYILEETSNLMNGKLQIFLPSQLMLREDPLENSWDVTSDTITAYIASKLNVQKLVLVTDVDGIFFEDPKKNSDTKLVKELSAKELQRWNKRTSVDKILPKILLRTKIDCYVVNGKYPERIRLILENKPTICTHIKL
jgi:aspartokinase-like uncharacterized kinase